MGWYNFRAVVGPYYISVEPQPSTSLLFTSAADWIRKNIGLGDRGSRSGVPPCHLGNLSLRSIILGYIDAYWTTILRGKVVVPTLAHSWIVVKASLAHRPMRAVLKLIIGAIVRNCLSPLYFSSCYSGLLVWHTCHPASLCCVTLNLCYCQISRIADCYAVGRLRHYTNYLSESSWQVVFLFWFLLSPLLDVVCAWWICCPRTTCLVALRMALYLWAVGRIHGIQLALEELVDCWRLSYGCSACAVYYVWRPHNECIRLNLLIIAVQSYHDDVVSVTVYIFRGVCLVLLFQYTSGIALAPVVEIRYESVWVQTRTGPLQPNVFFLLFPFLVSFLHCLAILLLCIWWCSLALISLHLLYAAISYPFLPYSYRLVC